jgi:hypothetical protein
MIGKKGTPALKPFTPKPRLGKSVREMLPPYSQARDRQLNPMLTSVPEQGYMLANALRSAAAHHTKCGRTGDVRQHGDRLPHTASR